MIEPMLAETASAPFDQVGWLFEEKIDGVRCIAVLGTSTHLFSRSGRDITAKFPELAGLHTKVSKPCVLDGEIACSTFGGIQHRVHREKLLDIRVGVLAYPVVYYVFDLLQLDGQSIMLLSLNERKLMLMRLFVADRVLRRLDGNIGEGIKEFLKFQAQGKEGVVGKKMSSTYQPGRRSPDWLKVKAWKEAEFLVVGVTQGEGDRASTFGSMVLAKDTPEGLRYVGNVGTGFDHSFLDNLSAKLPRMTGNNPFSSPPLLGKPLKCWLKPIKAEIKFFSLEADGKLRFPVFRRLVNN